MTFAGVIVFLSLPKVTQIGVTVALTLGGIIVYTTCALSNRKKLRERDLIAFGVWCAALVSGFYMVLESIGILKADEGTTRLYVCIFGAALAYISFQEAFGMIDAVRAPKKSAARLTRSGDAALLPPTSCEVEKEK